MVAALKGSPPKPALSLLWSALDRAGDVVLVLEHRRGVLSIVSLNAVATQVTGFSSEELAGRPFTALAGPDTDDTVLKTFLAAADDGCAHHTRLLCQGQSGRNVWLDLSLIPVPADDDGEPPLMLAFGRDVTALLRQEEQDRAVRALLAKVFVSVDSPVYMIDQTGRFLMTNPRFDRLVGMESGALVGTPAIERFTPSSREAILAKRRQQDIDGLDYEVDAVIMTPDGAKQVQLSGTMVRQAHLSQFRIIHVNLDPIVAAAPTSVSVAGWLQLIGLNEVRERLGPRWPEVSERAMSMAEHVLRKRLGPSDMVSRTDDQGFVVYFSSTTEAEAAQRAVQIGREIRARLIGQGQSPEIAHVRSVVVDATNLPPSPPGGDVNVALRDRVDLNLGQIQQNARAELKLALAQTEFLLEPVRSRVHSEAVGSIVRLPPEVERVIQNALAVLPNGETKAVFADVILLGLVRNSAFEGGSRGPNHLIFVTLSNEVFLSIACLNACSEACRAIPPAQRQRLILNVVIPPDATFARVSAVTERLRPFCRFVSIALPTIEAELPEVAAMKVSLIAVDASERAAIADWPLRLRTLIARLRTQKCRLMVTGAPAEASAGLFNDGVDFLSEAQPAPETAAKPNPAR